MSEWTTLARLARINPKTEVPQNSKISFIGMEDVSESFELRRAHDRSPGDLGTGYTRFRDGDLLFAKITPCMENGKGAVAQNLTNGFGMGSTEFHVLRPAQSESRGFLAHWLTSPDLRRAAEAMMTGSAGQRRVPADFFERYQIPSVPLIEQRRIAEVLDSLDDEIRVSRRLIGKFRVVRRGVVEDLIGCQEPTDLLGNAFSGSPANGIYKSAPMIGRGALLVGQTAFTRDRRVDPRLARRAVISELESVRFGLASGDILVSRVFATLDGVGQPALVGELGERAVFESNMMRLRCELSKADPTFVFETLTIGRARQHIVRRANLSNQASIGQSAITEMPVWLPDLDEQLRVSRILLALNDRIDREQASLDKLLRVKVGLAADLLNGRVRVAEAVS